MWEHCKTFTLPQMAETGTDDKVEQIAIAGTPDECREQLKQGEGLIDLSILYTPTAAVRAKRMMENHRLMVETFAR
jgi:alkanesulfonate monooxygenase SsuD/methylene tetrahydromethanopterin reductase-like flavin-dependent oxidoreductase (luciferase family)